MVKQYDYLIVGAGLYGAAFAYRARQRGKSSLVVDRRPHPGGNLYCEEIEGIRVHKYGPHIFHTADREVWDFVRTLTEFNRFTYMPLANYEGRIFNLPFNKPRHPPKHRRKSLRSVRPGRSENPGTSKSRRSRWSARIFTSC